MNKIALLYGDPIEGGGIEKNAYTISQCIKCDILVPKGKSVIRQKFDNIVNFESFSSLYENRTLDQYDIVIIPKLPTSCSNEECVYLLDVIKNTTAKVALVIHEARVEAFNKIPFAFGYVHLADCVFTFSETTQLTLDIQKYTSKRWGTDLFEFKNPFDYSEWTKDRTPFKDRDKRVCYFGRFATYKNPDKLRHLYNKSKELNLNFSFAMHGIDRSIGSKTMIIDLEEVEYHNKFKGDYPGNKIDVFGHYNADDASKFMNRNLFGYNGYNFAKMPHNYVFRLEYAQLEIMSAGCVPIFHSNLGESVKDSNGVRMIDYPHLAIWYKEGDEERVLNEMKKVSESKSLYNEYIHAGESFCKQFNDPCNCVTDLLIRIESVTKKKKTSMRIWLETIYYPGFYSDFSKCSAENITFLSSYDFERNQLRYINANKKLQTYQLQNQLDSFFS